MTLTSTFWFYIITHQQTNPYNRCLHDMYVFTIEDTPEKRHLGVPNVSDPSRIYEPIREPIHRFFMSAHTNSFGSFHLFGSWICVFTYEANRLSSEVPACWNHSLHNGPKQYMHPWKLSITTFLDQQYYYIHIIQKIQFARRKK